MKALVTGASGFIGRAVCDHLAARGVHVRAMVRSPGAARDEIDTAVVPDLTDRTAVEAAMLGVDVVIHLAARVHQLGSAEAGQEAAYERTNVTGTRILLEEAVRARAGSFIFASSVKAVAETSARPLSEDDTPAPADAYGRSKLRAESVVRDLASRHGLHAPILRLPLVYGPGMKANMLRLFELVDRGIPLPFGSARSRRSMLFLGNLLGAMDVALSGSPRTGSTFFVSDGEDVTVAELVVAIGKSLRRPTRLFPLPPALFYAAASAGSLFGRDLRGQADRFFSPLQVDPARLIAAGYSPAYTVAEGMDVTADWFRSRARLQGFPPPSPTVT